MSDDLDWRITSVEAWSADGRARAWVHGVTHPVLALRFKWGVTLEGQVWDDGVEVDSSVAQRNAEQALRDALLQGWASTVDARTFTDGGASVHQWVARQVANVSQQPRVEYCARCGIVRRADRKNKPCKGASTIALR